MRLTLVGAYGKCQYNILGIRKQKRHSSCSERINSMETTPVCSECGVPLQVSTELSCDDNGVISSRTSRRTRWVFYESENIDPLFRGIEELIGLPIDHIILESRRREAHKYIERVFPLGIRRKLWDQPGEARITPEEKAARLDLARAAAVTVYGIAGIYGYGKFHLGPLWETGDDHPWRISITNNPYSLLFQAGETLAGCEALEGRDLWVKYEQAGDETYRITHYVSDHPIELKGKARKWYDFKPGELAYERCPQCGVPLEIARCKWDLAGGTITDPNTGRRMAIFGSISLDTIFEDLEDELGEAVPETIIESQRLYIKRAWSKGRWNRGQADFQRAIALRGMGNLTGFDGDRQHLTVRINNSCLPLLMVGIVQALVEMAYSVNDSTCTWEFHDDGDLVVTVTV